jgi:kynurenine formamidase
MGGTIDAAATRDSLTMADLEAAAVRNKQWGRWGAADELGTLNNVTPEAIVAAARLVRKGKTFGLAMNFDQHGPQRGGDALRRFNPIHTMFVSGVDAAATLDQFRSIRGADDMVTMPLQCATQWDALSHIFYHDRMWNGYDCRLVSSAGAAKNGIEKARDRMIGRGVLLDIPRHLGLPWLPDGYGIGSGLIEACATTEKIAVGRGDFVIVRTGQMERCLAAKSWGTYAGGDAPGLKFETADWLRRSDIAAIATDTWGVEVRPNEVASIFQPLHWVMIPMIGLTVGEMFNLKELADDCAADGVYEFLFSAPPIPFTGAVGSPVNPAAIK